MNIEEITKIVNDPTSSHSYKTDSIIRIIAKDEKAIPNILAILAVEMEDNKYLIGELNLNLSRAHIYIQDRPEMKDEAKQRFNKAFVINEIHKLYSTYKDRIIHCFNGFLNESDKE